MASPVRQSACFELHGRLGTSKLLLPWSLWTTHLRGCPRLRQSVDTLHQRHLNRIDVGDSAPEEAQGGLHRLQRRVKDETLALKG